MKPDKAGRPEAILIAGPTASGKSALAMRLAARLGGIVVNADAMQVYADLAILTARPSMVDERRVPHALYGTVNGADAYSVNLWLGDVRRVIERAREQAMLPIIVGGTGLYFKALIAGLSDIPRIPATVRAEIRLWAAARGPAALHAELALRDPVTAARLRPTDPQRITRALEVHAATGRGLSAFQAERGPPVLDAGSYLAMVLVVDRGQLREAVDRRFDRMMADGALAEVETLAGRGLAPDLPVMRALGVRSLLAVPRDGKRLDEAVADAKACSRNYLKRQDTFFRTQLPAFAKLSPEGAELMAFQAFAGWPQLA